MMKVALTGGVASGKSELGRIWAEAGVPVVSADLLAREAVEPGTMGLEAVVECFGTGILDSGGALDRRSLRTIVFADPEKRLALERILHPIIAALRDDWIAGEARKGSPLVVAEIPLLFETGMEKDFDVVVMVDAPYQERFDRLTRKRGLGEEEARGVMDAQLPSEEKLSRATFVVHNSGTLDDLEVRGLALLDLLRARAAGRGSE